jgi:hypothetical protein
MSFRAAVWWVLACVTAAPPASAARQAGRAICGTVVDDQSALPVGWAWVRLPDAGREGLTGLDGTFRFDALGPGPYRIQVELEGFEPFEPPDPIGAESADPPCVIIRYALRLATEVRTQSTGPGRADSVSTAATTTLTGSGIAMAPGGLEDALRVLQRAPGVAASQDDRNDLLVRGGGAIENAVRIDGFDFPSPSHFWAQGGSGGGLSLIAPWLIERAVLRTGGFSVAYGERASSALDLTLESPSAVRLLGRVGASAGGAMGEIGGRLGEGRGSWLASARRSFLDLVLERGTDTAAPDYGDLVVRLEYAFSPGQRLELLGIGAKDRVAVNADDPSDRIDDRQESVLTGVSLHSQWTPLTSSAVHASYSRASIDAMTDAGAAGADRDRSTEVQARIRGELSRRIGSNGQLMVGAAVKRAHLQFDLDAKAWRTKYNELVPALRAHFPYDLATASAYGEFRTPTVRRFTVTPGMRLDWLETTGRVYPSPRVNLEFLPEPSIRVTAGAGLYRQEIPYIWIGSNPANASLDPIRLVQLLAGVSVTLSPDLDFAVEGFHKRYDGYPVDPREPWHPLVDAAADYEAPFVGRLDPGGRVRSRGVDATLSRRFGAVLTARASYSLWRVRQAGLDGVWRRGDYDIRHQFRVSAESRAIGGWTGGAAFRFASGRPYTPWDETLSARAGSGRYDLARLNASTYPAYHRLDLRADRTFVIRGTTLSVYAEVENVCNRRNVLVYSWNRTTRQQRPVYQWARLPVAGLRWEF